ncbi:MAG TPA: DUF2461 domain-containing protein [Bryobacteraceae bacterium]|jgi:uncharacterized protein (TIGR02453 family)|nr:DUF2461 domain-containing protein [Bryobacteraceae bacterium]
MFPGFSPEALTFLRGLKRNNRREWFQPRKEIFESKLKTPMIQLVEAINAELLGFAPDHITDPKKAVYRIYRDTRFSADKTPYKTHVAAVFPHHGLGKQSSAGFYFHLTEKSVGIAAGSYMPGPDELRAVRIWLAENHKKFRAASRMPQKILGKLQGSSVTRMPKGFTADHPAEDLIRMKQWLYWVELDVKLATTPRLLPELVKRFRAAAPVIAMLNAPLQKIAQKSASATSPNLA